MIDDLPDDVLSFLILRFFDCHRDVRRLGMTCKRLKDLSDPVYKTKLRTNVNRFVSEQRGQMTRSAFLLTSPYILVKVGGMAKVYPEVLASVLTSRKYETLILEVLMWEQGVIGENTSTLRLFLTAASLVPNLLFKSYLRNRPFLDMLSFTKRSFPECNITYFGCCDNLFVPVVK